MSRKRKTANDTVARISRPHLERGITPQNRTISIHKTATGRLGQTTSFVPIADPLASQPANEGAKSTGEYNTWKFDVSDNPGVEGSTETAPNDTGSDGTSTESPQITPLLEWVANHRQSYLDEMIRHDGRAGVESCAGCQGEGLYRCKDCFGFQLFCRKCFVARHTLLPLHRVLVR